MSWARHAAPRVRGAGAALCAALALAACAHRPPAPAAAPPAAVAPAAAPVPAPPPAPAAAAPAAEAAKTPPPVMSVDEIAAAYVRLVLAFDLLDPGYVDAYYGPPAWREVARASNLNALQVQRAAQVLMAALPTAHAAPTPGDPKLADLRLRYLKNQLGALSALAAMLRGQKFSFDDEARALYDVAPPPYDAAANARALAQVQALLPKGPGSLAQRYNRYQARFDVPRKQLNQVLRAALAATQAQARRHLLLPAGERCTLAQVVGAPWDAYGWYQGGYNSRIEVNSDQPLTVGQVIELAAREGYPGQHVYRSLQDQYLVRRRGWVEYSVDAHLSPQSFVTEGLAAAGSDLLLPWQQRRLLERDLFRLAGLSPRKLVEYDRVSAAARQLQPAMLEAARRYLDGDWTAAQTAAWLQEHTLASPQQARQRLAFFDHYRSYVVNQFYGAVLVQQYVQHFGDPVPGSLRQWRAYARLLSTPRVASTLGDR